VHEPLDDACTSARPATAARHLAGIELSNESQASRPIS
jgi:hypothetical protein